MYANNFRINLTQHFLGKVVTVLPVSTALPLSDGVSHAQYLSGELVRVDHLGIYLKHLKLGTLSFFTFPLVGIIEEQHIPENDPRYKEIQEEIKKKEEQKKEAAVPKKIIRSNQFVDLNELKDSLAKAKIPNG